MEKEIKKVKKQILMIILFSLVIFGLSIVLSNYIDNQWISIFIGFSGSIIGGIATMLAVYTTLTYDRSQRKLEENKINEKQLNELKNKKVKLKIILKNEMEMFLRYVESYTLKKMTIDIMLNLGYSNLKKDVKNYEEYYIDERFKEYAYELLVLAENNDEIEKSKLLLNFYNEYLNFYNFNNKNYETCKNNEEIIFPVIFLSNELLKLRMSARAKMSNLENFNFDVDKFNLFLDEFNNDKVHYNDMFLELKKFLEE